MISLSANYNVVYFALPLVAYCIILFSIAVFTWRTLKVALNAHATTFAQSDEVFRFSHKP